jgi:phosphoribosylglycinamide formyltransferase-1
MMKRVVVLFSGTGSNLEYILRNMHGRQLQVVAAICNNPSAKGIEIARRFSVPVSILDHRDFTDRESYDRRLVEEIESHNPDLTVLAGFMRILTSFFTERIRAVNLHPSLLPRHRGLHAIERSYEDDSPVGGVTVHMVSAELDGGEIVVQKEISKEGLDYQSYYEKIRTIEKEALAEGIRMVLGLEGEEKVSRRVVDYEQER